MEKRKILVIDDEEEFCSVIKTSLEETGRYEVMLEPRSQHGLSAAIRFRPDLILLDIIMPEKNGFQVLDELKGTGETMSIPVVMLSALDDEETKIKTTQHYAEHYLAKPIHLKTLRTKIEEILRLRPTHAEGGSAEEEAPQPKQAETAHKVTGQRPEILIVDDDTSACELLGGFLEHRGYAVSLCSEPKKAFSLFEKKKPGIVFLDLIMPAVTGMDILQMIRDSKSRARVIIMTGVYDATVFEDAVKLGADDILTKPYSLNQIEALVIKHASSLQ
jgi:two-component system cell cycle response regulator